MSNNPMSRLPRRAQTDPQAGSVTAFAVLFVTALLAVAGLVFDGGLVLTAHRRAINIAEQAARQGAEEVDIASVRSGGAFRLDYGRARESAGAYLGNAGYCADQPSPSDCVNVYYDAGQGTDIVQVTVTWSQRMKFLGLLGVPDARGTGTAKARNLHGVVTEEP